MKEKREKVYGCRIRYGEVDMGFAFVRKRTAKGVYIECDDSVKGMNSAAFGYRSFIRLDDDIAFPTMAEALKAEITRAKIGRMQVEEDLRERDKCIKIAENLLLKYSK